MRPTPGDSLTNGAGRLVPGGERAAQTAMWVMIESRSAGRSATSAINVGDGE